MDGIVKEYRVALETALQNVNGITSANIVSNISSELKGPFPALVVKNDGFTSNPADTGRNRWQLYYDIFVFYPLSDTLKEQSAADRLDITVGRIMDYLEGELHIGGALLVNDLTSEPPELVERPNQMLMSRLGLTIHILRNRSS